MQMGRDAGIKAEQKVKAGQKLNLMDKIGLYLTAGLIIIMIIAYYSKGDGDTI
jgi:hypothetical protein